MPNVNTRTAQFLSTPDGRLNRAAAAAYLGFSARTLANWQLSGFGPRSHKVGGRRFYWVADLVAFVANGGSC